MMIRPEHPGDAEAITQITDAAFAEAPHSGGNEARIVLALRDAGALTVSLVAVAEGRVVGHIAFSPVQVDGQAGALFGLGPVSVEPALQGTGIGKALVLAGLEHLRALGAAGCVLVGDPGYYSRFGFACDPGLTYLGHPNPYLQGLALGRALPRGAVEFHRAFEVD